MVRDGSGFCRAGLVLYIKVDERPLAGEKGYTGLTETA
jgi:hypothetical protein